MVFVTYLLENAILVLSRSEVFAHFFKPTVTCLLKTPGPTVGHLQVFQNAPGWWERLELT